VSGELSVVSKTLRIQISADGCYRQVVCYSLKIDMIDSGKSLPCNTKKPTGMWVLICEILSICEIRDSICEIRDII
jgi:hypothetical protein